MDTEMIKWIKSIAKSLEDYVGVMTCEYSSYDEDAEIAYLNLCDDYGNLYTLPITTWCNGWVIHIEDGGQINIERLHEWLFHQAAACLGA